MRFLCLLDVYEKKVTFKAVESIHRWKKDVEGVCCTDLQG